MVALEVQWAVNWLKKNVGVVTAPRHSSPEVQWAVNWLKKKVGVVTAPRHSSPEGQWAVNWLKIKVGGRSRGTVGRQLAVEKGGPSL